MESDTPSDKPKRDQLREEAAQWFARMRRPDAEQYREDFDAWLARGAMHRGAYNRIAEKFIIGEGLSRANIEQEDAPAAPAHGHPWRNAAVWLAFLLLVLVVGWLTFTSPAHSPAPSDAPLIAQRKGAPPGEPLQLATVLGEIRTFRLTDGSSVTLDTNSLLTVSYGETTRRLRLERGRARFDVAHETRPFIVAAGNGTVTARGTVFDVRITPDNGVMVSLLRGSVDVAMPIGSRAGSGPVTKVERLVPGEQIAFADGHSLTPPLHAADEKWPQTTIDFDRVRLADVIAEANRYSALRISLGDPSLGELRVSGTFRVTDARKVAERLAVIFGLIVDTSNPAELVLRRS